MRHNPHPLVATALALLLGTAAAIGTPAGTRITNQATAESTPDEPGAVPATSSSNLVETTVAAVCAVSVTPDGTAALPGQSTSVFPGERAVFAYRVTNAGNQPNTLALNWIADAASAVTLDPALVRVHRDTDADGVLDAGEPEISDLTLDADATASVLLAVTTRDADRGRALLALTAACAAALGGASDTNNVAEIRVGEPPRVMLEKTFASTVIRPGDETTVTLRATNGGLGASREIVVTDMLDTPALAGLTLVEGSPSASVGTVEYTADGAAWQATAPARVAGIRWRVPTVAAGATHALTFRLRASASADLGARENVATLATDGQDAVTARAPLAVRYTPALALGPIGNPEANPGGEGSADDLQTRTLGVVGQRVCFDQTVLNSGNVTDDLGVTARLDTGTADVTLLNPDGTPLTQPWRLAPGERANFRVCLTPRAATALRLTLEAAGTLGAPVNRTTDVVTQVVADLPGVVKSVTPTGTAVRGDLLTYTLRVTNPYPVALTGVTVRDVLDANLTFVEASDGGTLNDRTVTWTFGSIPAGTTRELTLRVRVAANAPDGLALTNTFTLTSDQTPDALLSNEVQTPVWTTPLQLVKTADRQTVMVGDRLGFTIRVRNPSTTGAYTRVTLTDTLPVGLTYLPGTSTLGGVAIADPVVNGRSLTWELGALGANAEAVVTLQTRVGADVGSTITNVAVATARSLGGVAAVSNESAASVRPEWGMLRPTGDLIGRVFVDRNHDGMFTPETDTPLARARVLLENGRQVLTDADGRYHFASVGEGVFALRLDPNSVPYAAFRLPQDRGLDGSRSIVVRGLTSADFPLIPLAGDADAIRRTLVRAGPLVLAKIVTLDDDGLYTVRLTLTASRALREVLLGDPLPQGATLVSGRHQMTLDVPQGETTLTYRFRFGGAPRTAVTDPTLSWRPQ